MAEINIPDEAYDQFLAADRAASHAGHSGTAYTFGIKAAAPLIVAADYERLVAELVQVQQRLRADDDPGVRKYAAYGVEEAISSVRARIAELVSEAPEGSGQ